MKIETLWLITIPRIVLGAIFASAALSYFWSMVFGWMLLPVLGPMRIDAVARLRRTLRQYVHQ
jgi:hypothetical protein